MKEIFITYIKIQIENHFINFDVNRDGNYPFRSISNFFDTEKIIHILEISLSIIL